MPPVVVFAALEIAATVGWITTAAAVIGQISIIVSTIQARRAARQAKDAYNAAQKDRSITVSLVDAPRSRIYGRVRNADGILFKGTYGDKKQYLQMVIALAAHEVDAIESVYFGDVLVGLDGSGYVTTSPWNTSNVSSHFKDLTLDGSGNGSFTPSSGGFWGIGLSLLSGSVSVYVTQSDGTSVPVSFTVVGGTTIIVSGGPSLAGRTVTIALQGSAAQSKARVQKFTGAPGQDLSGYLVGNFPSLIQSAKHRFEGIACLLVTLEYSQDAYPQGIPQISALIRGAKVYDRRTGVTAWTQNCAVIADDWARYSAGGGAADDELDTASFTSAANACDVTHTFSTRNQDGVVTNTSRPMYTCNIALDTTADASENFAAIVESMAGQWAWSSGKLRVRAGAYRSPVDTITESWLSGVGDIEIVGTLPRSERVNVITPTIYNSAANYTQAPQARVPAAAYIDLDGQELPQEITLEGVTDVDHASHICGVMMRESRQALTVKLPCKFKAYPLEVFDLVYVTLPRFGWNAKVFEVLATEMTQSGGVVLTLKETDASVFDPDAEFTRQDPAPNTALPDPFTVPALSIATIQSGTAQLLKQSDGTIVSRMLVTWAAVQDEAVRNGGAIEVVARRFFTDEQVAATVAGTETQVYLGGLQDGCAYAVTIRARNKLVVGQWAVQQAHVVLGKSAAPSNVAGLAAAVVPGAVRISWNECTDVDYSLTRLRYGASWAAGTPLKFDRPGTSYDWQWPALGSYTIWAVHEDSSGNLSTPVSTSVTVDSSIYIGSSSIAGIPRGTMNGDPGLLEASSSWVWDSAISLSTVPSIAPGALGVKYFACATPGDKIAWTKQYFPISSARTYNFDALLYAGAGNDRNMYLIVDMYKADGTLLTGADTGWGGVVHAGYTFAGLPAADVFTRYGADFGAGTARPIPDAAAYFRAGVLFQSSTGSTSINQAAEDIRLVDVTDARVASAAAAAAQAAADAANAALTNIASDSILSPSEKPPVVQQYTVITGEQFGIDGQATAYGITTEKTAYDNAITALTTYLGTLSGWNTIPGSDVAIVGATFRSKFADVYAARQALLTKIDAVSGTLATWGGVSGSGKPADNATRNYTYRQSGDPAVSPGGVVDGENWLDTGTGKAWQRVIGVWQPYVGTGSVDTNELAGSAATEIVQDTYAFGGAGTGSGPIVQRSFTYTPPVNCKINFTAIIGASQVLPDSGNFLSWAVSAGGGSDSTLGGCISNSGNRQTFACVTSFNATAGVSLTFKLVSDRASGNPAITLYDSSMRVEAIKR